MRSAPHDAPGRTRDASRDGARTHRIAEHAPGGTGR